MRSRGEKPAAPCPWLSWVALAPGLVPEHPSDRTRAGVRNRHSTLGETTGVQRERAQGSRSEVSGDADRGLCRQGSPATPAFPRVLCSPFPETPLGRNPKPPPTPAPSELLRVQAAASRARPRPRLPCSGVRGLVSVLSTAACEPHRGCCANHAPETGFQTTESFQRPLLLQQLGHPRPTPRTRGSPVTPAPVPCRCKSGRTAIIAVIGQPASRCH